MQTITTKYHPPTNTRGARMSAKAAPGRLSVPYEHALGLIDNHQEAAQAYAEKHKWHGTWVEGGNADGTRTWVCISRGDAMIGLHAACFYLAPEGT